MIEEEKKELSKKMQMVSMDDAGITSDEKPIIATQALATCFGILVYDEKSKKASLAHASSTWEISIVKLLKLLDFKESHIYKFAIIPGYYSKQEDHYHVEKSLRDFFHSIESLNIKFIPFLDKEIPSNAIALDENTLSYEFAYDADAREFVTEKVVFGIPYLEVNEKVKKIVN